jgi:hypothetical protein
VTATYWLGTFLRDQDPMHGARLGIEHMWRHLRLGLGYGLYPGQDVTRQGATLTLRRHPIDLHLGYASGEHLRLRWVAELLTSGDWVSRHTSQVQSPLAAQPDAGYFLVSAGARVRQELRLIRHLALVLALGLDVPLRSMELQTIRGTTTETIARTAPVRFRAELGLKLAAF